MGDFSTTQRWVATDRSAGEAAGAFVGLTVRRRAWWAYVAVLLVLVTLVFVAAIEEPVALSARLVWGFLFALVPTLVFAGLTLGLAFLCNRRLFRQRLWDGLVLESTIGEDPVALRGPLAQTTIPFDGIAAVEPAGDWVFVKQVGSRLYGAWPAALFPADDLARLRRAIAANPRGAYGPSGKVSRTS